jgi:hypothetical protein
MREEEDSGYKSDGGRSRPDPSHLFLRRRAGLVVLQSLDASSPLDPVVACVAAALSPVSLGTGHISLWVLDGSVIANSHAIRGPIVDDKGISNRVCYLCTSGAR